MVFDHLVRLKDVAANLAAPADVALFTILAVDLGLTLVFLDLKEFRFEHRHRFGAVLRLAAFDLAGHNDAAGYVRQTHGGFHLVHVLAPFAACAVSINPQVLIPHDNVDLLLGVGRHVDRGKTRMSLLGGIKGRDAHQSVHPALGLQKAKGVFTDDFERG